MKKEIKLKRAGIKIADISKKPPLEPIVPIQEKETKEKICCICKKKYNGFGNNALPLKEGRCCDKCNGLVILERLKRSPPKIKN